MAPDGAISVFVRNLERDLAKIHIPVDVGERLRDAIATLATRFALIAAAVAKTTVDVLLVLFFSALTTFFVLLDWDRIKVVLTLLLPIEPRNTLRLLTELRRLCRDVFVSTFVTAIAQGVLAIIGYVLFRVPQALFLGAMTALASVFPIFGTLFVWVPTGAWLILSGHVGAGVGLLVYGVLVIGIFSDYVLRPRLVGGEALPLLATYVALFGGLELFGFSGFLIGPVIAGVAISVIRMYERDRAVRFAREAQAAQSDRGDGDTPV
jgi:predicted PurR-regulated permease PerM